MVYKHKINKSASKEAKKASLVKGLKRALIAIFLILINAYVILDVVYKGRCFTVSLESENGKESNIVIYEDPETKSTRTYFKSDDIDFFSDISVDWLPTNLNDEANGSHNGRSYIAYTFYVENNGQETVNYWSKIVIDDVIKNVDDAIRVLVYKNGNRVNYAKASASGEAENGTVQFKDETTVMLEETENFTVNSVDKYTVVIFLEGDDPECTDEIIGGLIRMHMVITEEHLPTNDEQVTTEEQNT